MGGMFTLESASPTDTFRNLDKRISEADGGVVCYSRLPMRQLLRYMPSNSASMWWISEHESPQSVRPHPSNVGDHVIGNVGKNTSLVMIDGLDWFITKASQEECLAFLQRMDALSRELDFTIVYPVDPLAFEAVFWARLTSLAPKLLTEPAPPTASQILEEMDTGLRSMSEEVHHADDSDRSLSHLVKLPRMGFTHAILAKRMLQWKRMGFDLSMLEPALVVQNMDEAHRLYGDVEETVALAIDCMRMVVDAGDKLSVTERELYGYRFLSLTDVRASADELKLMLSSR